MTDVPPASETSPPQGWRAVACAALADGHLAILGSTFDVRAMLAAWREGVRHEDGPEVEVGNPFKDGTGAPARIWTRDGARPLDGPALPMLTPPPRFGRFPDGRWLVAVSRGTEEPLGRVIGPDGDEARRLQLGDGVEPVRVDEAGHVRVGWLDEGVFGNQGFPRDGTTWFHPGPSEPPSRFGLAAFHEQGSLVAHAPYGPGIRGIADRDALDVTRRTAWARSRGGHPIPSVAVDRPSRRRRSWVQRPSRCGRLVCSPPGPRARPVRPAAGR